MNSIKILNTILLLLLILNLSKSSNEIEYQCPRNSINLIPYELNVEMEVNQVSNLQHQPFTINLSGNVCNSTFSDTQVYSFGYGDVRCNLGSLYYGLQLSGYVNMVDNNGITVYNNIENYVIISKNPSNNYYVMKIKNN